MVSRLIDTDVVVNALRGHAPAMHFLHGEGTPEMSIISRLELVQGVGNKRELRTLKKFLSEMRIRFLPLTPEIGARASEYLEAHVLADGLAIPDALIAATAVVEGLPLVSGNRKHFHKLRGLKLIAFKP